MKNLNRRIDRLAKASGGDFQAKVRALSERLGVPAERILAAAKGHEAQLNRDIGIDGTITWEGFCYLRQLGPWA
jgi:hypothetical protein